MKRFVKILLVFLFACALALGIAACGGGEEPDPTPVTDAPKVTLLEHETSIQMGQTVTLSANVENFVDAVTWTSSDSAVATVSGGRVTGVSDGTAVITCIAGEASDSCKVTVASEESVALDRETVKVYLNQTTKVSATVMLGFTERDENVTWETGDDAIATVENGVVTGKKVGETTLTVRTAGGATATVPLKVMHLIQITLSERNLVAHPGEKYTITASVKQNGIVAGNPSVSWSTSDRTKVSLPTDAAGNVEKGKSIELTAVNTGIVTVTAEYGGEYATVVIDSYIALSKPEDFEALRNSNYKNSRFVLTNDVDFNGAIWNCVTPWAGDDVPDSEYFGGEIDGQGHTIKNINIAAGWNQGFLGQTAPTSVVRNISFENIINQSTSTKCGSIVSFNKGLIENCYIDTVITGDSNSTEWNCHGGICATNHIGATIRNCVVKVHASRVFRNTGAIVGYNCGLVENVYAVCTDAVLPDVYTMTASYGELKNCGVFTSEESFAAGAQLYGFSDKVWTVTGYGIPALYYYSDVGFPRAQMFMTKGRTYTLAPSNVKGLPVKWTFGDNASDVFLIEENADGTVTLKARALGDTTVSVAIANGKTAQATLSVKGSVLVSDADSFALDFGNPRLADEYTLAFTDEDGASISNSELGFTSSAQDVAEVTGDGVVQAKGAGRALITVVYGSDTYTNLIEVNVTGWIGISDAAGLDKIKDGKDKNYVLLNDVNYGGNVFTPITPTFAGDGRDDSMNFSGTFDGNGHTVSNVLLKEQDSSGMWGKTAATAVIMNANFEITAPTTCGEVWGLVSTNGGTIRNCTVKMKATKGAEALRDWRGGGPIAGCNFWTGVIENCIGYLDTTGMPSTQLAGSLIGLNQGIIENCVGIYGGNASVSAVRYNNGVAVVNCTQYATEEAAVAALAPFGSFPADVWTVEPNKLPKLKVWTKD